MKKTGNRKYIALLFILLLSITLAGCNEKSNVVAKIDDVEITEDELNDVLVKKHGMETLDSLITESIIKKEVDKANIKITDKELETEFEDMKAQYGGPDAFATAIAQANVTEADVKEEIKINISIKKLLGPEVNITDEEIAKYYEENKDKFTQVEQVNASHILVKDENEANDIVKKLEDGEDFAELAKKHSIDKGTKANGGKLGFFGKGKMVEQFDAVAFDLKEDKISQPVKSDFGYHIIVVHEKKDAVSTSLDDNKDDIKSILIESKMPEAFSKWYAEKIKQYDIKNNLLDNGEEKKQD